MARISIYFGNIRKFKASFYDTECLGCTQPILKGDPCGYIDHPQRNAQDMFCHPCLDLHGTHSEIKVTR